MKRRYLAGVAVALATVVAIVVAVLAFSGGGGAGDTSATATDGTSEGITVHGHWVIEIRDPDGSLVSRTEVDNALTSFGKLALVDILSRTYAVGLWEVRLIGTPGPCEDPGSLQEKCIVVEPNHPLAADTNAFDNLTVTDDGESLILSGHAIAERDSPISAVQTRVLMCPLLEGTGCTTNALFPSQFTSAALSPIVDVIAGQQVLVTVTFTFS
jgi:hypothetical protein